MKITSALLNTTAPQSEVDKLANRLLVDMARFSAISCSDGRFYGVTTSCDTCGAEFNSCIRNRLISSLFSTHVLVESELGYDITSQFHTESIPWDGRSRIQTLRPGISAFAVREKINQVSGDTLYPVSPYIIEEAPLTDSGSGYCIVQLDRNIVDNPDAVTLRLASGAKLEPEERFGFPRRTADNWELALPATLYPPPCEDEDLVVNVTHCRYIAVVVDKKTVESGEVVAVYPGTNQKIPLAKPVQEVDETHNRLWFNVWDLLDPVFFDEGMKWENGEFYKLIEYIELKNFTTEPAPITVTYRDLCCNEERYATEVYEVYEVIDSHNGIVELYKDGQPCSCGCGDECKLITAVEFSYQTTPEMFIDDFGVTLAEAISWLIAAELPLKVCDCPPLRFGFVATAQQAYTKITVNMYTGKEIENLEHGNLYGQAMYTERINRTKHYKKVFRL